MAEAAPPMPRKRRHEALKASSVARRKGGKRPGRARVRVRVRVRVGFRVRVTVTVTVRGLGLRSGSGSGSGLGSGLGLGREGAASARVGGALVEQERRVLVREVRLRTRTGHRVIGHRVQWIESATTERVGLAPPRPSQDARLTTHYSLRTPCRLRRGECALLTTHYSRLSTHALAPARGAIGRRR